MNLAIDVGNTRVKVAVFEDETLISVTTEPTLSIGRLTEIIGRHANLKRPINTIISSVAERYEAETQWLQQYGNVMHFTPASPVPLAVAYHTPETLGSDRLAAAVAAWHHHHGQNLLVFQLGSCLTHEFITLTGHYAGGGISPGMEMRLTALHTFTGRLPLITYRPFDFLAGQTTEESILSGVINGMTVEIDGFIDRYREKYGSVEVVLTGGDLIYFDKRLKNSIFAHPNLVLEGLNIILGFNESTPKVTADRQHSAD